MNVVLVVVKFVMLFNCGVAVSIKFGGVQGRGEGEFLGGLGEWCLLCACL